MALPKDLIRLFIETTPITERWKWGTISRYYRIIYTDLYNPSMRRLLLFWRRAISLKDKYCFQSYDTVMLCHFLTRYHMIHKTFDNLKMAVPAIIRDVVSGSTVNNTANLERILPYALESNNIGLIIEACQTNGDRCKNYGGPVNESQAELMIDLITTPGIPAWLLRYPTLLRRYLRKSKQHGANGLFDCPIGVVEDILIPNIVVLSPIFNETALTILAEERWNLNLATTHLRRAEHIRTFIKHHPDSSLALAYFLASAFDVRPILDGLDLAIVQGVPWFHLLRMLTEKRTELLKWTILLEHQTMTKSELESIYWLAKGARLDSGVIDFISNAIDREGHVDR